MTAVITPERLPQILIAVNVGRVPLSRE